MSKKVIALSTMGAWVLSGAVLTFGNGFYLSAGLQEALSNSTFRVHDSGTGQTYSTIFGGPGPATSQTYSTDLNNGNLLGNIALGYGYDLPHSFYLGGEFTWIFGDISTTKNRQDVSSSNQTRPNQTFSNTITRTDYAALDLIPGYRINNQWLVFGRLGIVDGQIKITQDEAMGTEVRNGTGSNYPSSSTTPGVDRSQNRLGYRLGLGIDYIISKFSLGADYIYTFYSSYSFHSIYSTDYSVIPRSNALGIHVKYAFD